MYQLETYLAPNEKVLWAAKPKKLPFLLAKNRMIWFGLIWGVIDLSIILGFGISGFWSIMPGIARIGIIVFFALHLFPFWMFVFRPFFTAQEWKNTEYLISDKRIYLQGGTMAADVRTTEYTAVSNIALDRSFFGNLFHVADVVIAAEGGAISFLAVEDAEGAYRRLKSLSLDVKSDIYYPNALRPDTNPGYRTDYKPQ